MAGKGKHVTPEGLAVDCTLKPVFDSEIEHWKEWRQHNKDDHDELFAGRREHDMRLTKLETKLALYSAGAGALASLVLYAVERFIS